jgi:carboxypeptidase C (cathepsin A)
MRHLPIPDSLKGNIEYRYYESGHMVYAHLPSLKAIHDNVAAISLEGRRGDKPGDRVMS